jgi:hypothetical protein
MLPGGAGTGTVIPCPARASPSAARGRGTPVPGFVVFDQLSRPYDTRTGEDEEAVVAGDQREIASLRMYFDAHFEEVAHRQGLQVLVLEHAYFPDDPRFRTATRERWIEGERLIPGDWPDRE